MTCVQAVWQKENARLREKRRRSDQDDADLAKYRRIERDHCGPGGFEYYFSGFDWEGRRHPPRTERRTWGSGALSGWGEDYVGLRARVNILENENKGLMHRLRSAGAL